MKIRRIPVIFMKETSSCQRKKPIKVPTKGSIVTKMAAFPVSRPFNPKVYKIYGRVVQNSERPAAKRAAFGEKRLSIVEK